jgi:MFS family permease
MYVNQSDDTAPVDGPDFPSRREAIRNLIAVSASLIGTFLVYSMALIAVPLNALDLGATPLLVGFFAAVPFFFPLVFAIPTGTLVTRIGGTKVILLGSLGLIAGPGSFLLIGGYAGITVAQIIIGMSHLIMVVAAQTIIASLGTGKRLEQYFGWYAFALSGAQLVGPLFAGFLIDFTGSLALPFYAMMVTALLSIFSAVFITGRDGRNPSARKSAVGFRAQWGVLRSNPRVKLSIIVTVGAMFTIGAYANFLPVYLEALNISATMIGALVSLRALASMSIRPVMSPFITLLGGRASTLVIMLILLSTGLGFTGVTVNVWLLGFLAVMVGIGTGVSQPLSVVVLAEGVADDQRPGALGMRLMCNRGAQLVAPLLLGALVSYGGFETAFLFGSIGIALMIWPTLRLLKTTPI